MCGRDADTDAPAEAAVAVRVLLPAGIGIDEEVVALEEAAEAALVLELPPVADETVVEGKN